MKAAACRDWREELGAVGCRESRSRASSYSQKPQEEPSSVERVVSLRIKSISNLSVLLHCFVATEKVRKIILDVTMTPSCLINIESTSL